MEKRKEKKTKRKLVSTNQSFLRAFGCSLLQFLDVSKISWWEEERNFNRNIFSLPILLFWLALFYSFIYLFIFFLQKFISFSLLACVILLLDIFINVFTVFTFPRFLIILQLAHIINYCNRRILPVKNDSKICTWIGTSNT